MKARNLLRHWFVVASEWRELEIGGSGCVRARASAVRPAHERSFAMLMPRIAALS
jgi:hypothetical protein